MKNDIKISVIIPVYNVYNFISKCLDSIINQTLKDIEIIVVNDGSPDDSQKIIDKYVKKYPKLIKSFKKENGGQGSARNLGLSYASGEYISFIDSDDWIDKNMLLDMYNLGIKNNSDIVICDMDDYCNDELIIKYNCTKYDSVFKVTPSASNKIFKRSIIGNIRFLSKKWYEDFNFTTKILFNTNKISTISKNYYHCNVGHESTMNNNNSYKNLDMIFVIDDIIKYLKDNNKYDNNIISYLIFDHILITTINRVNSQNSKDKKEVIDKLVEYCKENINDYKKMDFYNKIPTKRKIIAWLNYNNLFNISKTILKISSRIKE